MSNKINISIPEPCHENWQKMTPLKKGRFCDSCQKQVSDFTKSSDSEILRKFNSEKNSCGRFLKTQLERDIVAQKKKSNFWIAGASGILSFLSLGNQEGFSQEIKIEQTDNKIVNQEKSNYSSSSEMKISGYVSDQTGPLPGASIINLKSEISTFTDIDGNFSISTEIGDEILITYVGYESQTLKVQSSEKLLVTMEENEFGEVIVVGMIALEERRTFFGRVFRSIGNIFR